MTDTFYGYTNFSTYILKGELENVRETYDAINALRPANDDISTFADAIENYVLQSGFDKRLTNSDFHVGQVDWVNISETWLGDMDPRG